MNWRRSYKTRVLEEVELPFSDGKTLEGDRVVLSQFRLVLGGWSPKSLMEQTIWRKLYEEAYGSDGFSLGLVIGSQEEELVSNLQVILPQSLHPRCVLWPDASGALRATVEPELDERAFAYSPAGKLLMVGPATEDAWDEMLGVLRQIE